METCARGLQLRMRDDSIYCDYINKFCCLPVFGQRLTFMKQTSKFVFDPPPVRHFARGFKISNELVRDWIIDKRLEWFTKSKLYSEFNLCKALQKMRFKEKNLNDQGSSSRSILRSNPISSSGFNLLDDLKNDHLTKVRHIRRFLQFVAETSEIGKQLINFWIEVDYIKQSHESLQPKMLKDLKKKYYLPTSLSCLPYHILEKVYLADKANKHFEFGMEFTTSMQNHALKQLHFYWLPQYLISCRNVGQPEKLLIRKLELLASQNKEEELKQTLLQKSTFIRHIPRTYHEEESKALFQKNKPPPLEEKDSIERKFFDDHEDSESDAERKSDEQEEPPEKSIIKINQVKTREFVQLEWRKKSKFFFDKSGASSSDFQDAIKNTSSDSKQAKQVKQKKSDESIERIQSFTASQEFKRKFEIESDLMMLKKTKKAEPHPKATRKSKSDTKSSENSASKIPKSTSCFDRFSDGLPSLNNMESSFVADFSLSSGQFCKSNSSSESSGSKLHSRHSSEILPPPKRAERPSILRKRRQAFVDEESSQSVPFFTQDAHEYLENVEASIGLPDVLTSDIVAASPFRRFLADLPKVQRFGSLITNGEYLPSIDFTIAYDIWQEIEELRTSYFELSINSLKTKVKTFISTYEEQHRILFRRFRRLKIRSDCPFPNELLSMQHAIEKLLGTEWVKFAIEEQEDFRLAVVSSEKKIYPRRHSFPMTVPETLSKQILPTPLLSRLPGDTYDDFEEVVQSGRLGSLGKSTVGHMKYRISRAYCLLTNMAGRCVASDSDFMEMVAEESSDDEGGLPMVRPRTFARQKRKMKSDIPDYMRPVKRNGVVVHRPTQRPKNFTELLKDWTHFEFFKKYMKMHESDAPLLFWKAVQVLKKTGKQDQREEKAKEILHKYFGRAAGAGAVLQCGAEIISEIVNAKVVTTSMLIQAAHEVAKSMENTWSERYYNTFTSQLVDEPEEEPPPKQSSAQVIKSSRAWKVLSDYIRSVACFLQCMKNPNQFNAFRRWLKNIPEKEDDIHHPSGVEVSSTALLFKKYEFAVYKHVKEELDVKYQKKKVLGKEVVLNFLVHDFMFWFETQKFVHFCDNVKQLKKLGVYERNDIKSVKQKRNTIVKCFINSDIPPKLRINISAHIAHEVMFLYKRFDINRSMFHQARMAVFPILMIYWKKYRRDNLFYVSKKMAKEMHKLEVEQRRIRKEKIIELRKQKMLAKKLARLNLSTTDLPVFEDHDESFLPEPEKKQEELENKRCQKVKGLVPALVKKSKTTPDAPISNTLDVALPKLNLLADTDPPKLYFSLESGMKFVVPPKKKAIEKMNYEEVQQEEPEKKELMPVWAKGSKFAKVVRQGSDPLLVDPPKKKHRYLVRCDLVNS